MKQTVGWLALCLSTASFIGCDGQSATPADDQSQDQVVVAGTVHLPDGAAVSGCMVSSTGRSQENAITTDDEGQFTIGVRPGSQTFSVVCPSQAVQDFTQDVTIAAEDPEDLDFELQPE